ncbi:hypothetical protein BC827DRAFT_1254059 [Russula dissimulans]|nr:hypothetical protein BC827DRAFT_1254059 [Russula dissimulans]
MKRKRAEASGGVVMLDPARLKPGGKVSGKSKFRMPRIEDEDESLKVQDPARARATRDWWRMPGREWAERLSALGCLRRCVSSPARLSAIFVVDNSC